MVQRKEDFEEFGKGSTHWSVARLMREKEEKNVRPTVTRWAVGLISGWDPPLDGITSRVGTADDVSLVGHGSVL